MFYFLVESSKKIMFNLISAVMPFFIRIFASELATVSFAEI